MWGNKTVANVNPDKYLSEAALALTSQELRKRLYEISHILFMLRDIRQVKSVFGKEFVDPEGPFPAAAIDCFIGRLKQELGPEFI